MTRVSAYTTVENVTNEMGMRGSRGYTVTAQSGAGEANPDRVFIGSDYVGHFTDGMKVQVATYTAEPDLIDDPGILLREVRTVAALGSDYLTLDSNLTNTYPAATTSKVFSVSPYTEATCLTWSDIDKRIQNYEDYVDSITHQTWKQRAYREYYNFDYATGWYSNYSGRRLYWATGMSTYGRIYLLHKPVRTLDTTVDTAYTGYVGDSIVVWYNDEWTEIFNATDPYTTGNVDIWTAGRGNDYWLDYEDGTLTFGDKMPDNVVNAVHIGYRAGHDGLRPASDAAGDGDIEEATKMLVKRQLLQDTRFVTDFPGGGDALSLQQAISGYKNDASNILRRHVMPLGNMERF